MRVSVPQNPPRCLSFCPSSGALLSAHQLHPGHRFCLCFRNSTTWYCKGVREQSYLPATSVIRNWWTPPAFSSYSLSVLAHPKKNSNLAFCSFRPGRHWFQNTVGCGLILYLYRPSSIKIFCGYSSLSCTSMNAKWLWLLKFCLWSASLCGSQLSFRIRDPLHGVQQHWGFMQIQNLMSVALMLDQGCYVGHKGCCQLLNDLILNQTCDSGLYELLLHNAGSSGTCVGLLQYTTVGVLFSKLIFHACCTHIQ